MSSADEGFEEDFHASDDEVRAGSDYEDTSTTRTRAKRTSATTKKVSNKNRANPASKNKRKRLESEDEEGSEQVQGVAATTERRNMFDDEDDEDDSDDEMRQITGSEFLTQLLASKSRPVKDLGGLELKADHVARPLWIDNHGRM